MNKLRLLTALLVAVFGYFIYPVLLGYLVSTTNLSLMQLQKHVWFANAEVYGLISLIAVVVFALLKWAKLKTKYALAVSLSYALSYFFLFNL